jgi:hypothetical protein
MPCSVSSEAALIRLATIGPHGEESLPFLLDDTV